MSDPAPSAGKTILLVDDEEAMRMVLHRRLTASGYRLLLAADGVEALEVLAKEHPDLILLDAMMPRMNGLETCRRVKSMEGIRDIPVIVLTANVSPQLRADVLEAGALACLYKPLGNKELLEIIKQGLSGSIAPD